MQQAEQKVVTWFSHALRALAGNVIAYAVAHAVPLPADINNLGGLAAIVAGGGAIATAGLHYLEHYAVQAEQKAEAELALAIRRELVKLGVAFVPPPAPGPFTPPTP